MEPVQLELDLYDNLTRFRDNVLRVGEDRRYFIHRNVVDDRYWVNYDDGGYDRCLYEVTREQAVEIVRKYPRTRTYGWWLEPEVDH